MAPNPNRRVIAMQWSAMWNTTDREPGNGLIIALPTAQLDRTRNYPAAIKDVVGISNAAQVAGNSSRMMLIAADLEQAYRGDRNAIIGVVRQLQRLLGDAPIYMAPSGGGTTHACSANDWYGMIPTRRR